MSIIVLIHFPLAPARVGEALAANPQLAAGDPIRTAIAKHGGEHRMRLTRPDTFIDIDAWPSRDAYQAFKTEAADAIAEFEAALGVHSRDEIWQVDD